MRRGTRTGARWAALLLGAALLGCPTADRSQGPGVGATKGAGHQAGGPDTGVGNGSPAADPRGSSGSPGASGSGR